MTWGSLKSHNSSPLQTSPVWVWPTRNPATPWALTWEAVITNAFEHYIHPKLFVLVLSFELGGERNMKQRIPINSITSKLVLKSMYASCSTGPFFADHYSHRFEKTQLKFRQEKWLPVKISCIIWNEICKKKKLIKNRNGIFCQKFLIFLKSLKSLNKNFY